MCSSGACWTSAVCQAQGWGCGGEANKKGKTLCPHLVSRLYISPTYYDPQTYTLTCILYMPSGGPRRHLKNNKDKAKFLFVNTHNQLSPLFPFFSSSYLLSFPWARSTSLAVDSSVSHPASDLSAQPGSSAFRIPPESSYFSLPLLLPPRPRLHHRQPGLEVSLD